MSLWNNFKAAVNLKKVAGANNYIPPVTGQLKQTVVNTQSNAPYNSYNVGNANADAFLTLLGAAGGTPTGHPNL